MKSKPIIMQDFSIAGIRKQWEYQERQNLIIAKARGGRLAPESLPTIGCKTETRRTRGLDKVNENPDLYYFDTIGKPFWASMAGIERPGVYANFIGKGMYEVKYDKEGRELGRFNHIVSIKFPYGVEGDELWVKESYVKSIDGVIYRQNFINDIVKIAENKGTMLQETKWKSPLFMPKTASRIKLQITSINVERLHDITEEGAMREGVFKGVPVPGDGESYWYISEPHGNGKLYSASNSAVNLYRRVWIELNDGEAGWNKNPWVWVIGFNVKEFNN